MQNTSLVVVHGVGHDSKRHIRNTGCELRLCRWKISNGDGCNRCGGNASANA